MDNQAQSPEDTASDNLLQEQIYEVLDDLPPREAQVLKLRYGLHDGIAYRLQQVGDRMGITRERVRQIEAQALSKLRNSARRLTY
jgi:RNA polymerase primary sigma factor